MPRLAPPVIAALLVLSVSSPVLSQSTVHKSMFHDYRVVTVVPEMENPWSIAFLPGGDMLVTERPGRLRIVRDGALLPDPVPGTPAVFAQGQGGLMDVVPHPSNASEDFMQMDLCSARLGMRAVLPVNHQDSHQGFRTSPDGSTPFSTAISTVISTLRQYSRASGVPSA